MIAYWQLKDIALWLCISPEVWHIWGVEGGKRKIWLYKSLSCGNTAAQSILLWNLEELSLKGRVALQKSGAEVKSCLKYMFSIAHPHSVTALYPISTPVHLSTVQMSLLNIQELLLQMFLWSKGPRNSLAPRRSRNKVMKTENYPKGCWGLCGTGLDLNVEGSQEKGKKLGGAVSDIKLVLSHSHPFFPYLHVFC